MESSAPRIPKPGPYNKPKVEEKPPVVKKPYIPKPHLTARPFQDSEELRALQKNIQSKTTTRRTNKQEKNR